jgi:hypothetical protein
MKYGVILVLLGLLGTLMLSGCPKSNEMLDHSKKEGAVQDPANADPNAASSTEGQKGGL